MLLDNLYIVVAKHVCYLLYIVLVGMCVHATFLSLTINETGTTIHSYSSGNSTYQCLVRIVTYT